MYYVIVAEFNPFHNGHKYLIDALKSNGENTVTVVMSESFVQRGECACVSPYARTKMALLNGADLVLSLPVPYATASAERFALGGLSVLGGLGCVDSLAFGAESSDADMLKKCAGILARDDFSVYLEKYLNEGVTTANRKASLKERYQIMTKHYGAISTLLHHAWFVVRAILKPEKKK